MTAGLVEGHITLAGNGKCLYNACHDKFYELKLDLKLETGKFNWLLLVR